MNAVGHRADRHFILGPVGEEWLEYLPAYFPVELAHAIHLPAATHCKMCHVEVFRSISRILSSHREQIIHGNGEFIHCVVARY